MSREAVPMHPEATDDPRIVRWFVPADVLPVLGDVVDVPSPLRELVAAGTIASITVEARAVVVSLAPDLDWAVEGSQVQGALAAALLQPEGWRGTDPVDADAVLQAVLQDVLDGPAGDYIRSHGGEAVITEVSGCRAEVRMSGTCTHCPAVGVTLHSRLEAEVRDRFPALVELRAQQEPAAHPHSIWARWRRAVG